MKTIGQINIESRQVYFFNDMTNVNDFDPSLLNIDEIFFKSDELIIYDIKYIKNLNSLNTFYLVFNNLDAYIGKSGENGYLIFASTEKIKIMLKNYTELWDEIKNQIELITGDKVTKYSKYFLITGDKVTKYSKDFMKIRFKTNDNLLLKKIINIPVYAVIVNSIFKENNEYHPQVLLPDCFYVYEENINPPVV